MLPAIFHAKVRDIFRSFSKDVRFAFGDAILDLQHGAKLGMPLSRPMPSVGAGVSELRVKDRTGAYRAFYVIRTQKAVIIFHAFQKKTPKTPKLEIEVALRRLKELL